MFFYIGKQKPLDSLNQVADNLYLDEGWGHAKINEYDLYYKGYSTDCNLFSKLENIGLYDYNPAGKWCVLVKDPSNQIKIKHPKLRGFPLYSDTENITNLKIPGYKYINFNIDFPIDDSPISMDDAAHAIKNIILGNIQNFFKYNHIDKLNLLFSGGIDTLTVWAVLDIITPIYNLDIYIPKTGDTVLTKQVDAKSDYESDLINHVRKTFWGYNISRFYKQTNWNITGFYSERHQLREVNIGINLGQFFNSNIYKLTTDSDYIYHFIRRSDNIKQYINRQVFSTELEFKKWSYQTLTSDNQMWHLDNTFHFSPLSDTRITDIIYRLSINDMLENFKNGIIQKKVIEQLRPDFLLLLSDYKNSKDIFSNFKKNWNKVRLNPRTKITIR